MKKSSLASAAMFARQAERPAHGIEKTMAPYFRAGTIHPVFFRRRKRESKQVDRSGNKTAPHAQSKRGALEDARRRRTGRGKPLGNLKREPTGNQIGLNRGCEFVFQGLPHEKPGAAQP